MPAMADGLKGRLARGFFSPDWVNNDGMRGWGIRYPR